MSARSHRTFAMVLALGASLIMFAGFQSDDPGRSIAPEGKQEDPEKILTPEQEVKRAIYRYYNGLNQVLKGDTFIMDRLWEHTPDVTMASSFGGITVGWDAVGAEYQQLAEMALGGRISAEQITVRLLQDDLACVTHVEHCMGIGEMGGPPVEPRATKILRRDGRGEWKVIYHHADKDVAFLAAARRAAKAKRSN